MFVNQLHSWLADVGDHIENTLEALQALIRKDNETPGGLKTLAYIEFDVHVSLSLCHVQVPLITHWTDI